MRSADNAMLLSTLYYASLCQLCAFSYEGAGGDMLAYFAEHCMPLLCLRAYLFSITGQSQG